LVRAALEAPTDDPRFEVVAETGDATAALDLVGSVQLDAGTPRREHLDGAGA